MKNYKGTRLAIPAAVAAITLGMASNIALADEPCDDFGECKVLIEINATDGDVGFHFLIDGDDLNSVRLHDPDGVKVFQDMAKGPLKEQKLTETFVESAEPVCHDHLAEEDDVVVTLEEFLERWTVGTYVFTGSADEGEKLVGTTDLTFLLPAAPVLESDDPESGLGFDGTTISWAPGDDLGECATFEELEDLVEEGVLPMHPEDVEVAYWEIVFEPDVADGSVLGPLKFTIRVAGEIADEVTDGTVTVPLEYLDHLPANTKVKIEVGAIGVDDNATFTEIFDICVNEIEAGCPDDDDDEDEEED